MVDQTVAPPGRATGAARRVDGGDSGGDPRRQDRHWGERPVRARPTIEWLPPLDGFRPIRYTGPLEKGTDDAGTLGGVAGTAGSAAPRRRDRGRRRVHRRGDAAGLPAPAP